MQYGILATVVILVIVCCTGLACVPIVLLCCAPVLCPDSKVAKLIAEWRSKRKDSNRVYASDQENNDIFTARSEKRQFIATNDL